MHGGMMGGFGFGGMLMGLLLIGAVLFAVFALAKRGRMGRFGGPVYCEKCGPAGHAEHMHGPGPAPAGPSQPVDALKLLDERLAKGDIDVKDYVERKQALLGDRSFQDPPKFD